MAYQTLNLQSSKNASKPLLMVDMWHYFSNDRLKISIIP